MVTDYKTRETNYLSQIQKILNAASVKTDIYQTIVDAPFHDPLAATYLGLGIVVILLVSKDGKTINRIALSNTLHAAGAQKTSELPFKKIKIPSNHEKNIIAKAIRTGNMQTTEDWYEIFTPALSVSSARFNQAHAGIVASIIWPFKTSSHSGALIFSLFHKSSDIEEILNFSETYTTLVSDLLSN